MLYACLTCRKEREIGAAEAWPSSCECGGTTWTSAFHASTLFAPVDASAAANAALRQPGAPRIPAPHY